MSLLTEAGKKKIDAWFLKHHPAKEEKQMEKKSKKKVEEDINRYPWTSKEMIAKHYRPKHQVVREEASTFDKYQLSRNFFSVEIPGFFLWRCLRSQLVLGVFSNFGIESVGV